MSNKKLFIEIGSNAYDTLFYLLDHGWMGVMVEPVPEVFFKIPEHPNLMKINAAISENTGTVEFFHAIGLDGWSSLIEEHHQKCGDEIKTEKIIVESLCFDDLMKKVIEEFPFCENIDLLKIDAEGYDDRIIHTVDFDRYRVQKIIYEHMHLSKGQNSSIFNRMKRCGMFISSLDESNIKFERL